MNSKTIFKFNNHDDLKGKHALFSPSQSSWLRYTDEQIIERILNQYRAPLGTEIHEYAAYQIELGHRASSVKELFKEIENHIYLKFKYTNGGNKISKYGLLLIDELRKMPNEVFETLKCYINDGIRYRMTAEKELVYSDIVSGTADAISFKNNLLRIHDLKTGSTPVHMEQLEVYAALFCLEYNKKPTEIDMELRIYQMGKVIVHNATAEDIFPAIDKIITIDKLKNNI